MILVILQAPVLSCFSVRAAPAFFSGRVAALLRAALHETLNPKTLCTQGGSRRAVPFNSIYWVPQ